tara:strand:+ start:1220 stop:2194 length:975 start_codon:yes stop_codon:yes gene_type:complete
MRFAITGELGFIGTNLAKAIEQSGNTFVSLLGDDTELVCIDTGEPCVYGNSEKEWERILADEKIDVLIHNAAVVGTDVVALNSEFSTLSNVMGTHTIARAANKVGVPVCYTGTTVIYDTKSYQDCAITELSELNPKTFYGIQKLAAEQIIKHNCDEWMIVRPLFAYGGHGDMNSLIAKTLYSHLTDSNDLDMFLDPTKIKDYMHVVDFCEAVVLACTKGLWCDDFNVSAENPYNTQEIVSKISDAVNVDVNKIIKWHPETDYLGNHILSSEKFRNASGWSPRISLDRGIQNSWITLLNLPIGDYNPLKYLNDAKEKKIDLTEYY